MLVSSTQWLEFTSPASAVTMLTTAKIKRTLRKLGKYGENREGEGGGKEGGRMRWEGEERRETLGSYILFNNKSFWRKKTHTPYIALLSRLIVWRS